MSAEATPTVYEPNRGLDLSDAEKNSIISTEYSIYAELREVKRLVGSLDSSEDDLEQVWRIADSIQSKIRVFSDLFEKAGIYITSNISEERENVNHD